MGEKTGMAISTERFSFLMASPNFQAEHHAPIPMASERGSRVETLFRRWPRYLAMARSVINQVLKGCVTDLRLLARHWKGGVVFRQTSTHGFAMLVRTDEEVGRQIYCRRQFEIEETEYIRQKVRNTDICFDVGANVGYYTLLLAKLCAQGQVHSFEPVPLNRHLLAINLLTNQIENVFVNQSAVGDSQTQVDFMVTKDAAYSSFVDTGRKPVLATMRVQMETLDNYCRERGISQIGFLKVDVEGAEGKVIEGASQILGEKRRRPRFVMLELNESMLCKHGSSIRGVLGQMQAFGYRPFVYEHKTMIPFEQQHYNLYENVFFITGDA
jgi:FkbM family methyltransferase